VKYRQPTCVSSRENPHHYEIPKYSSDQFFFASVYGHEKYRISTICFVLADISLPEEDF
jgi:hypothetical protein